MDAKKIGKAIQFLRKRVGYTQQELAERLTVSDKAVSKWERGQGVPDISLLRKLSIILDTDIDSLLEGSVAYHENTWKGLLYLEGAFANAFVYDKHTADCLLSYFMLAKVRDIIVFCEEGVQTLLQDRFEDGGKLGISLTYCRIDPKLITSENIARHSDLFGANNVMLIYRNCLIYGVDLTRFLQRGLINDGEITILAYPKNAQEDEVRINHNKQVVDRDSEEETVVTKYNYCALPLLFCPHGLSRLTCHRFDGFDELIQKLTRAGTLYAEWMDKGFISIELKDPQSLLDASSLVRILQERTGSLLYCPEEIAYRRGMIGREELMLLAGEKEPATKEYLLNICKIDM